jgi:hypothetical protein
LIAGDGGEYVMVMTRGGALGAIVLTAGFATAAHGGDLLVRTRVTIQGASRSTEEVCHWTGGKKVIDGERLRSIIDYQRGTVTTLDKRDRTYRVTKLDDLRREIERMTAMMNRGLRGLSRERRDGMGQAGFDPRPRFTLRPTGRSERIAGHPAYELILDGGPLTGSIWVNPDIRRPSEDREWAPFTDRFGGLDVMGSKFASAMARLRGWPVRTDLYTPADTTVHSEVVDVRLDEPAPELLELPEGYRAADGVEVPPATGASGRM